MERVAYLVNQYPKGSHTFIRREIAALEREGVGVVRFSVRPVRSPLVDEADQSEARRTQVLLEGGSPRLALAALQAMLTRPERWLEASKLAWRLGRRSERGLLRHFAYLAEACLLRELAEQSGVQHVHAHFGTNSATVALLCYALGGPRFSFTVHGPEEFDKPAFIGLPEKVAQAAFVVAISHFGRSQLLRHSRYQDWNKIHVVRCGLDETYLGRAPTPVPAVERLVCIGRLSEQKGQLLLIEAAAKLEQAGTRFELVLVGDGEMRAELERSIGQHRLNDRVRITGWVDGDAVRRELEAARALVLPSFAEGLPIAILEAYALGRPVISTLIAGIPEVVEPNRTGWLVPAGNVDALAEVMTQALRLPAEELGRMALAGRQRVLELHDIRLSAEQLKQLMDTCP